jgi:LysR family transcriptional activator of nhaA
VVLLNQAPTRDAVAPFVVHRLAEQKVNFARPSGCAIRRPPASLLKRHPVILPAAGSSIRAGFDAFADRLGIRLNIATEAEDMAMMRLLARENLGLAVLPPIVVKDEIASKLLLETDHLPGIAETFYAITIKRRFSHPLPPPLLKPLFAS